MTELHLTHAFVRNLTKGIREAYGREKVRHTDVLKTIAKAAGREPGPMMHALKTAPRESSPQTPLESSTKFYSFGLALRLLSACNSKDRPQIQILSDMLAPDTSFAKLALAVAHRYMHRYRDSAYEAEYFVIEAFLEDGMWLTFVASEIGACDSPEDEMYAFGREHYGESWLGELAGGSILPRDFRFWAAHTAIRYGLLRFVGSHAVFPQADTSEGSLIHGLRAGRWAKAEGIEETRLAAMS
ncbi:hypothetical protein HFN89_04595 [Rhizobium laguerreae]|nr:hypothetical protein [Rhizobium laguerreae]